MDNDTPETITIQLSKGLSTTIDLVDGDLALVRWYTLNGARGMYYAKRDLRINKKKTTHLLHRVILSRMLGREMTRSEIVDHINGNPLDNRRSNLRLATQGQNTLNQRLTRNNKSGLRGVWWNEDNQNWRACVQLKGKRIYLGSFKTAEEAHQAYLKAAKELHGEFARLE